MRDNWLGSVEKALNWIKGKKTIVAVVALTGLGLGQSGGYLTVPMWVYLVLGACTVLFLRAAIGKTK